MSYYVTFPFQHQFKVVHMLVFFPVGFLNDETWLNVASTRTLMKAPLCQNIGDIVVTTENTRKYLVEN